MRFKSLSDEELELQTLAPSGTYKYKVIQAQDKTSYAGNEYTALTLKIWNDDDMAERAVFTNMAFIKLLNHFCKANNMMEQYASGNIPAQDFIGKCGGKVVIGIEGEKPDGKGGTYKAKNVVKDYIIGESGADVINEDLPF